MRPSEGHEENYRGTSPLRRATSMQVIGGCLVVALLLIVALWFVRFRRHTPRNMTWDTQVPR